ncbi:alpha/beta hydrolase [Nocardia sp. NBC_01730]|uniref:alpha/beta hydrolase n=1 Tax=Nocardia sp. NBC_01730 TaxID=2975998 RepID=UPI002E16716E|nr:alpha/beta hydrolase [Nocardia sp. NBC_01730]
MATAERARADMNKQKPDPIPPAGLRRRHLVTVRTVEGFPCYTVASRSAAAESAKALIYVHGGAYIHQITHQHWRFISRLVDAGCRVEVPLYGLAPQHVYGEAFPLVTAVHRNLLDHYPPESVIWAGDSAGAGLALAVTQTLPESGLPMPARLILLSPWLDITMSNPQIRQVEQHDPWLSSAGLIEAGRAWAGGDDPHDPRLSPINGPIAGLPPLDVYIGTADVFDPDARRLREMAEQASVAIRLTEVDGAFHVYALAPVPEARAATQAIIATVRQF